MSDPKNFAHLDLADKDKTLPEIGKAIECGRVDCPAPNFEQGYGLAGGGIGVYEFCEVCQRVISKTQDRL